MGGGVGAGAGAASTERIDDMKRAAAAIKGVISRCEIRAETQRTIIF